MNMDGIHPPFQTQYRRRARIEGPHFVLHVGEHQVVLRELADGSGVSLDDIPRWLEDFAASTGVTIEESVEHLIGAMQYLGALRVRENKFSKERKVDWKKEGF